MKQLNPRVLLLIQIVGTGLVIGAVFLLLRLDEVVNVLLYKYGLQFDYEWAVPYWTLLRTVLAVLGCVAGVSAFAVVLTILGRQTPQPAKIQLAKDVRVPAKTSAEAIREIGKETTNEETQNGVEIAALPMVCNKCGKVFSQPLCMFDFKSGRPRLVNVCPYCNAVLAVSGNSKGR
jgi:uncharacterized Zn-finger protein